MREVRNRDVHKTSVTRIPPGAYVSKFYHHDLLTLTRSGNDVHVTGARLIELIAVVVEPSTTGPVIISFLKNDVEFKRVEIPESQTDPVVVELNPTEQMLGGVSVSMDFEAIVDRLQIEIVDAGVEAATLTVLGVFDR